MSKPSHKKNLSFHSRCKTVGNGKNVSERMAKGSIPHLNWK